MIKPSFPIVAALTFTLPAMADDVRTETLSSGSILSILMVDPHHEHRNAFRTDVLPVAMPAITSAGGRLVATFETIDVEEGSLTPRHVYLMEWPSIAALESASAYLSDASVIEANRNITQGIFSITEDVSLSLQDGVVYEFFGGLPAGPDTPTQLQTFFQNVIPTALEYGRADALVMQPVEHADNSYFRPIAGLATWPSAAAFEQFTTTTVFLENVEAYRDPAFADLDLINTYFVE